MTSAVSNWLHRMRDESRIVRGGYFGSYARGDEGVGSDIDIVAIVTGHDLPFERRASEFDTTHLPVPADLLVYTASEWAQLASADSRFARVMRDDTVWIV